MDKVYENYDQIYYIKKEKNGNNDLNYPLKLKNTAASYTYMSHGQEIKNFQAMNFRLYRLWDESY